MKRLMAIFLIGSAAIGLWLVGCEGDKGPAGPPGTYPPSDPARYLGDNSRWCAHCHEAKVEGWDETHHAGAYEVLVQGGNEGNLFCLQCHTTGFDDEYDSAGNLVSEGLDNGGYDDNPVAELRDVQCEACHCPMGPTFGDHTPTMFAARTGEACGECHNERHTEYMTSGHGHAIENEGGHEEFVSHFGRSSCQGCHISEGFMIAHDDDWADRELPEDAWQVTCATCHDVHSDDTESYLRGQVDFETQYGGEEFPDGLTISDWGSGQLCGQCHHARRDRDDIMDQINNGDDHPGPHHSSQADMQAGYGSYEIPGYTYEHNSWHTEVLLPNLCVDCHMYSIDRDDQGGPLHGHSFEPDVENVRHATVTTTSITMAYRPKSKV